MVLIRLLLFETISFAFFTTATWLLGFLTGISENKFTKIIILDESSLKS